MYIGRECGARVGGPGAVGSSLVCTLVLYESNDTAVVGTGALPRANRGDDFLGPRISSRVVYQQTLVLWEITTAGGKEQLFLHDKALSICPESGCAWRRRRAHSPLSGREVKNLQPMPLTIIMPAFITTELS